MTYTRRDQQDLRALREKLQVLEAKEQQALRHVVETLREVPGMENGQWQVQDLVMHADAIRDALEPFDSGTRLENQRDNAA